MPVRGIIEIEIDRVQDSCGWGVPLYEYQGQRDRLVDHCAKRTQDEHISLIYEKNAESIDGLPGAVKG